MDSGPAEFEGGNLRRQITIPLLALVGLAFFYSSRGWRYKWYGPLLVTTLLFAGWLAMSVLWSAALPLAMRHLVILVLFFLGAYGMVVKWPRDLLVSFVAVATSVQVLAGVITEIYLGAFAPWDPGYRFSGNLHPNGQGQLCAVLVIVCLATLKSRIRFKLLFFVLAVMGFICLVLTKSLTSMAGFVAGFTVYSFLRVSRQRRWRLIYLGVMSLMVAGLLLSAEGLSLDPISAMTGRDPESMTSFTGRVPLWIECMHYAFERPVLGFGYEGFWTYDRNYEMNTILYWTAGTAHSAYIDLWLQLGIVGLILHTILVVLVFRRAAGLHGSTHAPEYAAAAAVAFQYLVFGALESTSLIKTSAILYYSYCLFVMVAITAPRQRSRAHHLDGGPLRDESSDHRGEASFPDLSHRPDRVHNRPRKPGISVFDPRRHEVLGGPPPQPELGRESPDLDAPSGA
jgi:O-antigen ligase